MPPKQKPQAKSQPQRSPQLRSRLASAEAARIKDDLRQHPLYPQLTAAIEQAMFGKGERHGGANVDFMAQPWVHYAQMHGRGFLTGQAAKKLEEAASLHTGEQFRREVLGAIVYLGMALIYDETENVEIELHSNS